MEDVSGVVVSVVMVDCTGIFLFFYRKYRVAKSQL